MWDGFHGMCVYASLVALVADQETVEAIVVAVTIVVEAILVLDTILTATLLVVLMSVQSQKIDPFQKNVGFLALAHLLLINTDVEDLLLPALLVAVLLQDLRSVVVVALQRKLVYLISNLLL
jgi:hypothetical protein